MILRAMQQTIALSSDLVMWWSTFADQTWFEKTTKMLPIEDFVTSWHLMFMILPTRLSTEWTTDVRATSRLQLPSMSTKPGYCDQVVFGVILITGAAVSPSVAVGLTVGTVALFVAWNPHWNADLLMHYQAPQFKSFKADLSSHQQTVFLSTVANRSRVWGCGSTEIEQSLYNLAEASIKMRANEAYRPVQHWFPCI